MKSSSTNVWSRVFEKLLDITAWVAGAIIVIIMLMTVYEVVSRRLFGAPTSWALDMSTLGLLVAALIPTAFVQKLKGHVSVELVYAMLSVKNRNLMSMITYSFALLGCIIFAWQGIDLTLTAYREKEMLFRSVVIPKLWYIWIFSFSFLLVIIQLVIDIIHFFREYKIQGRGEIREWSGKK